MAAVLTSQSLLVPCSSKRGAAAQPLEQQQVILVDVLLRVLVEGQDPWGSMLDFSGEDRLNSIDEFEGCFSHGLGGSGADGPQHRGVLIDPVLAAVLKAVEASCLESFDHLSICSLGLSVASWMSYLGKTKPCAQLLAVCPEEATGEL